MAPTEPSALKVHCWAAVPLQSQICSRLPSTAFAEGMSMQRPEPLPMIGPAPFEPHAGAVSKVSVNVVPATRYAAACAVAWTAPRCQYTSNS
ncbi:hypothetical protein AB0H83_47070 [Dactylosporangium sp. NPDC050688]|uniref:hypothetical protein n=1 Tax=Dactylosporangium sp. NPDC050688 TaxID=3157217 RepID=UPI00340ECE80